MQEPNSIEQQYLNALQDLKEFGKKKAVYNSKLGSEDPDIYILSLVGRSFHHDMALGFPLYTTKFVYWKGAIYEMLWFLSGHSDVKFLHEQNVHIWDKWAEKRDTDLLKLHYTNMTNWRGTGLNQTEWILEQLPKEPERKSYVVTYLDPETTYQMANEAGQSSVDIVACHYQHHVLCQKPKELTLTVSIRSQDMFLGNPFNVAQYAALLEMYCLCLSNRTGDEWTSSELVVNCTGDYHLYSNHLEQIDEQLTNRPRPYPKLHIENRGQRSLTDFHISDFSVHNYLYAGKISGDVYAAGGYS